MRHWISGWPLDGKETNTGGWKILDSYHAQAKHLETLPPTIIRDRPCSYCAGVTKERV